jgi:nicotinamide mononucleotide adenylyltransferase
MGFIDPEVQGSILDFVRCMRPNNTFYGTSGKCRKGVEVGAQKKQFETGVTWGKFNIPTPGHARVVKRLLEKSDEAQVIMSGAKTNVDWNLRNLMFRRVLRQEGVDVSKVKFVHAPNTYEALKSIVEEKGGKNVVMALGEDRKNYLESLSKKFEMGSELIPRSEGSESSTMMRGLIDSGNFKRLKEIYKDDYLVKLARYVRAQEKLRDS